MQRLFLLLLIGCIAALAQPSKVRTVRATHQQIKLSYEMRGGIPCEIEVSEEADFDPLVPDVDGSLFTNAQWDLSRSDTTVDGDVRTILIGHRTAEVITDNSRLVSRSLQANTIHYIRLCGSVTVRASTKNIPFGLITDPVPQDPRPEMAARGYYGFPSIKMGTDLNTRIIEPRSGALIKPYAFPTPDTSSAGSETVGTPVNAAGGTWVNPADALTANGTAATVSDTSVLSAPNAKFWSAGGNYENVILSNLNLTVRAAVSAGATGDDAVLQVALGFNACKEIQTDWQDIALTDTLADHTVGDAAVVFSGFWSLNDGEIFFEGWFKSTALKGFCFRKKTSSGHTLSLDHVSYTAQSGALPLGTSTSGPLYCGKQTTTDSGQAGKKFLLCYHSDLAGQTGRIYSFETTQGTGTYLGPARFSAAVGFPASFGASFVTWDQQNPRRFYVQDSTNTHLHRCDILTAANTLVTPYAGSISTTPTSLFGCTQITQTGYTVRDQMAAMNHPDWDTVWLEKTYPLQGILKANDLLFFARGGIQGTGGFASIYDPDADPPAGCVGCEGKVIAVSSFGATKEGRLFDHRKSCPIHTWNAIDIDDFLSIGCARQYTASGSESTSFQGGPWAIQVTRHADDGGAGDIPAAANKFQLIAQGGRFDWVDRFASTPATMPIPLEVGDLLIFTTSSDLDWGWYGCASREMMQVTAVNPDNSINVLRGPDLVNSNRMAPGYPLFCSNPRLTSIPANSFLYLKPPSTALSWGPATINWNYRADPLGLSVVWPAVEDGVRLGKSYPPVATEPTIGYEYASNYATPQHHRVHNFADHGTHSLCVFLQHSTMQNPPYSPAPASYRVQGGDGCTLFQLNKPVTHEVNLFPRFAGEAGGVTINSDVHPKARQWAVPVGNRERDHIQDLLPYANTSRGNTAVSGNTYRFTSNPALKRKVYASFAFTGDRVFRDISGPANCTTTPSDVNCIDDTKPWTYCVVLVAEECWPSSTVGQVYFNNPLRTSTDCIVTGGVYSQVNHGGCIQDLYGHIYGPLQSDYSRTDLFGIGHRRLGRDWIRPVVQSVFAVAQVTPESDWLLYQIHPHGLAGWVAAKLPPFPQRPVRSPLTWEQVKIDLYHPTAAKFRVQIGYYETGGNCTTRLEPCYVDTATITTENAPFKWESESPGYITCTNGRCQAELPRYPGRFLSTVIARFYDTSSNLIESRILPPQ